MRTIRFREALREAMIEEMEKDDRVFLMGEEVGHYQGAYKVSEGMLEKFGEKRVIDTPIAEAGFAGIGVGAAMVGLRPIVEFMTWNFSAVAFDQILNNAAKVRQMSGGQFDCPIVFRGPNASARQVGSQHSHAMEHFYATVPGLKVVAPAFPADAKGLLKAAIRDDDPVLFFEHKRLYRRVRGDVPDGDYTVPIGEAAVAREGEDVSVITYGAMVHAAVEAAESLAIEGVSVEVVDLRSLAPLDREAIARSVAKTSKVVVVHEDNRTGGVGAEVSAFIAEELFEDLDGPIVRVAAPDVPAAPYSPPLEEAFLPKAEDVAEAVRRLAAY